MAPLTSVTFVAHFWGFALALGAIKIPAEPGQTVVLPCQAHIPSVAWSRSDLWPKWVLLYRDGHADPETQHPLLKDRVELRDKQMSRGDASLVLRNVMVNDTGTYECRVTQKGLSASLDTEPVSVVVLDVRLDPDSARERLLLRIMMFIVVCSPYFVSTLHAVSLCRKRNAGNKSSASVATSPSNQHLGDVVADSITEHHLSEV